MDTSVYKIFLIGYIVFQVIAIVIAITLLCLLIMSSGIFVLMGGFALFIEGHVIRSILFGIIMLSLFLLTICYICLSPIALYATYKTLHQRTLNKIQKISTVICPIIAIIVSIIWFFPVIASLLYSRY